MQASIPEQGSGAGQGQEQVSDAEPGQASGAVQGQAQASAPPALARGWSARAASSQAASARAASSQAASARAASARVGGAASHAPEAEPREPWALHPEWGPPRPLGADNCSSSASGIRQTPDWHAPKSHHSSCVVAARNAHTRPAYCRIAPPRDPRSAEATKATRIVLRFSWVKNGVFTKLALFFHSSNFSGRSFRRTTHKKNRGASIRGTSLPIQKSCL